MGNDQPQFSRFGDDGRVGVVAPGDGLCAQPGVLLVHDGGDYDVTAQIALFGLGGGH